LIAAAGLGVDQIVGEQRFVPVEGGTRFEWSYKVLPKHFLARQVIRSNMDAIEGFIAGGLERFTAAASDPQIRFTASSTNCLASLQG